MRVNELNRHAAIACLNLNNDCGSLVNYKQRNLPGEAVYKDTALFAAQGSYNYGDAAKTRTGLVPLRVCSVALGVSEIQVMQMIEEGRLRWAFDLRRKTARRAFVLVMAQNLLDIQQEGSNPPLCLNDKNESDWNKALQLILPHQKPLIKGSEIVRAFSISSQHMMNLVNDGALVALNARRGRTATPVITRDSVIKLLKERRIV
ncbi:MAG: hypothetical protein ACP5T0_05730 [Verrucomicrobiia bacterium]